MAARRGTGTGAGGDYWAARVRSPAFKRALVAVVRDQLRALAAEPIGALLDRERVRQLMREWDARVVERAAMVEVVLESGRRLGRRLTKRSQSLFDLLDPALLDELDAVIADQMRLTPRAEAFIARLMGQEFMRGMFTDLIYSALVSFYRRVDPIFGDLAVRALEGQIKSFIRLFMPMVQKRATAFAIAADNRGIVAGFARAVVHQLFGVPLGRWVSLAEAGPRQSIETLLRHAATNPRLVELGRQASLAAWDELHAVLRHRTLGELLRLDAQATWLAERAAALVSSALERPAVLEWIAAEAALAQRVGAAPPLAVPPLTRRRAPKAAARQRPAAAGGSARRRTRRR